MKAYATSLGAGSLLHGIVASAAMMSIGQAAFAQASSPVTSSVFVHRSFDTGNSAVNQNFQYITHPPVHPVAASEPAVARGSHAGRRGRAGTTGSTAATSGGTADTPAVPLPQMPADASSNAPVAQ